MSQVRILASTSVPFTLKFKLALKWDETDNSVHLKHEDCAAFEDCTYVEISAKCQSIRVMLTQSGTVEGNYAEAISVCYVSNAITRSLRKSMKV